MAKIDEKFIVKLQGKDFVTYEGLLDLAHQKGLISIDVELLQVPSKDNDNVAIAKAIAKTEKETFVDIGDAGPKSVNRMISPHIIRMASTRAKARALRDLTNVGMTAVEEIMEDEPPKTQKSKASKDKDKQALKEGSYASENQLKFIGSLMKQKEYTAESMRAYIKQHYNKESSKDLTSKEASQLIKTLQEIGK